MKIRRQGDVWVAEGEGPLRPYACEGSTRGEAFDGALAIIRKQIAAKERREYAEAEMATARSLAAAGESYGEDLG